MPSPMPPSRFLTAAGLNRLNHAGEPLTVMLFTVPGGVLSSVIFANFGVPEISSVTSNHSLVMVRLPSLTVWVCM